jgi:hypothetical protein
MIRPSKIRRPVQPPKDDRHWIVAIAVICLLVWVLIAVRAKKVVSLVHELRGNDPYTEIDDDDWYMESENLSIHH